MLTILSKIANVRRFVWTFYLAWVRLPVRTEELLTISRRVYTAQCVALALLVSSGSTFLVDWYVRDHRANIISELRSAQLKLSELIRLQKDEENRRFVENNIKILKLDETNLGNALQQLSRAASFSRIASPAIYPLIVGAASLVFAITTTRRSTEHFSNVQTLFHFTFLSFVIVATVIIVPVLAIHTQASYINEITRVRSVNLECWIGVTDPDGPKILLETARNVGRDAGVFYTLDRIASWLFGYVLFLLALGLAWTCVRISLLTRVPARKVMAGSFCAVIAFTTLNLLFAAVAPSYAWVEPPPEPCVSLKAK